MERIAQVIAKHPRRVLAATAAVTLLAVVSLFRLQFNADVASFLTEGNERGEAFAELQDEYDAADPVNVVLTLDGGTFLERDRLVQLATFAEELRRVEGVATVASLVPERSPLDGREIAPALLAAAPQPILDQLTGGPLSGLLLSEDGRSTLLMVVPSGDGVDVARTVGDLTPPEGAELTVAGNPAIYAAVIDILSLFLLLIPPVVLVLLLATFYANVGERRLTLLAVIPALLGSLWTFGFLAAVGREIDVVTVIVPIFVLVMGSADGLHFVTHFQDVAEETEDDVARVVSTLREVGVPMILTTVSTAVGFLSLLVTDIQPIRQLGLFAAVGITFAGIISFFSLPAALTHADVRAQVAPLLGGRLTGGLRRLVARRWPAPTLVALVVAFAAVFIPQLEVDSDPLFMFTDDAEVRQAFDRTEELFGGATPLTGEFAYDPTDRDASLASIRQATDRLEARDGVREVFSVLDLVDALPPEAADGVLAGETPTPMGRMVSDDGMRFLLLPDELGSAGLRELIEAADADPTVTTLTGLPVLWDEMARLVLNAQVWSVLAALGLVFVLLLATYRRLRPTLVALVPLVLTIAALLGFIAASGIQLNMITAVASSIVIGVGIDYAIHFVAAMDHARAAGGRGYVLRAIDRAGRPIVANALGIAIALTALLLSPLRPHHHISGIMWVSMTVAALGALVVMPALLPREGVAADDDVEPRVPTGVAPG